MELELYAMSCGWLTMPMPAMLAGEEGRIKIPVPTWLIRHPKGTLLFDSGLNRVTQQNSADYLGAAQGVIEIHFEPGEEISARLEAIGFDPARIDILVNSHLHFDHAGGNALIPNARLLVQKREWEAAHEPDFTHSFVYNPDEYDLGHQRQLLDGEHDLFDDGSVLCMPTYGHTPGHQSLRVRSGGRDIVLAADACYLRRTLEELKLPAVVHDAEAMHHSLLRLRALQARGAEIFYGHDPEFWRTLPQAPARIL